MVEAQPFQTVFRRYERKYLLTLEQYEALNAFLADKMTPDRYGQSTVCNLYYDTPDFYLIRTSMEKPYYKEKLRVRCYSVPNADSVAFVEIKKKCDGIVYKRRIHMPYKYTEAYLTGKARLAKPSQIGNEIDFFRKRYRDLRPAMVLTYHRRALYGIENPGLRITFDSDAMWRVTDLDLTAGAEGTPLFPEGYLLMEIKIPEAMPLWLAHELDRLQIHRISYSKYGRAFTAYLQTPAGKNLFNGGNQP